MRARRNSWLVLLPSLGRDAIRDHLVCSGVGAARRCLWHLRRPAPMHIYHVHMPWGRDETEGATEAGKTVYVSESLSGLV